MLAYTTITALLFGGLFVVASAQEGAAVAVVAAISTQNDDGDHDGDDVDHDSHRQLQTPTRPPITLTPQSNNDCFTSTNITTLTYQASGTTVGSTADFTEASCGADADANGVWYSYTPIETKVVTATVDAGQSLRLYSGSCNVSVNDLECLGQDDPTQDFVAQANINYHFLVSKQAFSLGTSFTIEVKDYDVPSNDYCRDDIEISSLPYQDDDGSTLGALPELGAVQDDGELDDDVVSCGAYEDSNGVWYSYTPDETKVISTSVDSDQRIRVYSGTCASGLDCEEEFFPNHVFVGVADTKYSFLISKQIFDVGSPFSLEMEDYDVPANDECVDAPVITTLPYTVTGSTVGALPDFEEESCGGYAGANGVWYSYEPTESMIVRASVDGEQILRVYTGSTCDDLTCIGDDPSQTFLGSPNTKYKMLVSKQAFDLGSSFTLRIEEDSGGTPFPTFPLITTPNARPSGSPSVSARPSVSSAPYGSLALSETPSVSSYPSAFPSESGAPSMQRSVSLEPSISIMPSVSAEPSTSSELSVSSAPSDEPSGGSIIPVTFNPTTKEPTKEPTKKTTNKPTLPDTLMPTLTPTFEPTRKPTNKPTPEDGAQPTTVSPTEKPTPSPTEEDITDEPTYKPTSKPRNKPTLKPTMEEIGTLDPTPTMTESPAGKPTPPPVTPYPTFSMSMDHDDECSSKSSKTSKASKLFKSHKPSKDNDDGLPTVDLSMYGYPYAQDTSAQGSTGEVGWVTWPPEAEANFLEFTTANDGVNSTKSCAAKCQEENAPSGAWSTKYQTCYCVFVATSDLCREPCVKDQYIDFSTMPISQIAYCEKSICDEAWYYNQEYCDVELGFDKDVCAAKIEQLKHDDDTSTSSYSSSNSRKSSKSTKCSKSKKGKAAKSVKSGKTVMGKLHKDPYDDPNGVLGVSAMDRSQLFNNGGRLLWHCPGVLLLSGIIGVVIWIG